MAEEQDGIDDGLETPVRPPPVLLQAERVRASRPRHSLPRRVARAARAALQSHFPALPAMKGSSSSASSRIPLAPERAAGLFRSGALETHISRALGNTVGMDGIAGGKLKESLKLFSAVKSPLIGVGVVGEKDEGFRPLQLAGKHSVSALAMSNSLEHRVRILLFQLIN